MNVASLVLGICGAVLASLSLGWQAANYVLTGGRVKVTLLVGALGNGGMATARPQGFMTTDWWENLGKQGFRQPIVAVRVANVGRQPVKVERWGLVSGLGTSLYPLADSIGPGLPHRLDVGEAETWAVDFAAVDAFITATRETLGPPKPASQRSESLVDTINAQVRTEPGDVVAIAELADGRTKRSKNKIR
jgi:hypothetical protein